MDYMNYYYQSSRKAGICGKLLGKAYTVSYHINDICSFWTHDAQSIYNDAMFKAFAYIKNEAARYGISLDFSAGHYIDMDALNIFRNVQMGDAMMCGEVSARLGWSNIAMKNAYYKEISGCDSVASFYLLNKEGRSFAIPQQGYFGPGEEYTIIFTKSFQGQDLSAVIAHELLHLYGALDLYFPYDRTDIRRNLALQWFPNDIMTRATFNIYDTSIGEYTAYRIGWTDYCLPQYAIFQKEYME